MAVGGLLADGYRPGAACGSERKQTLKVWFTGLARLYARGPLNDRWDVMPDEKRISLNSSQGSAIHHERTLILE